MINRVLNDILGSTREKSASPLKKSVSESQTGIQVQMVRQFSHKKLIDKSLIQPKKIKPKAQNSSFMQNFDFLKEFFTFDAFQSPIKDKKRNKRKRALKTYFIEDQEYVDIQNTQKIQQFKVFHEVGGNLDQFLVKNNKQFDNNFDCDTGDEELKASLDLMFGELQSATKNNQFQNNDRIVYYTK